jgi:arylsulfatase A-like enzyme
MAMTTWPRRKRKLLGLLLPLCLTSFTVTCRTAPERSRPNVVVVLIDTLRPDYLGFYGYEEENAPFLAELARNGVVFERAFSTSSWTAPSTASLFTSLYPPQHGIVEGFLMHRNRNKRREEAGIETIALNRLPAEVATLPEAFQSMGYTTFGLAANINIGDEIGFSRGFDRFERRADASAPFFLERVTAWRDAIRQSEPFFLYLHLNDVHLPYRKRKPYYEKQEGKLNNRRARYLSEIAYADEHLRKIYETLDLGSDAILVVLSDHGEEFRDHGGLAHQDKLYIELNRVLMMVHAPALELEPRRVTLNVSLVDVLPTLIELAGGIEKGSLGDRMGVSLVPALSMSERTGELIEALRERTLFAHRVSREESEHPLWAATLRHWKLIETADGARELYNHRRDPIERHNLYSPHADGIPMKMIETLEEFKKVRLAAEPGRVEVEVDPELEEQLRSLGYVN